MTPIISTHPANDDPRHYRFERDSKLPLGTFPRGPRVSPDAVVFWVCAILVVLLLVAAGWPT